MELNRSEITKEFVECWKHRRTFSEDIASYGPVHEGFSEDCPDCTEPEYAPVCCEVCTMPFRLAPDRKRNIIHGSGGLGHFTVCSECLDAFRRLRDNG